MEDQLEVMDGLLDVRCPVLVPVTSDVLDHIALQEGQVVAMNIPDRLNSHLFIMVTCYLRVSGITHFRLQKCRTQ